MLLSKTVDQIKSMIAPRFFWVLSAMVCFFLIGSGQMIEAAEENAVEVTLPTPPKNTYQVEVIVFQNQQQGQLAVETWPEVLPEIDVSKAVSLSALEAVALEVDAQADSQENNKADSQENNKADVALQKEMPVTIVTEDKYLLKKESRIIQRNSRLKLIKHSAWLQELNPSEVKSILPVHFEANSAIANENEEEQISRKELIGVIRIKPVRSLFHVNAKLLFYPLEKPEGTPTGYCLTRQARLKHKEIYYFDHPAFGVLLTIAAVTS